MCSQPPLMFYRVSYWIWIVHAELIRKVGGPWQRTTTTTTVTPRVQRSHHRRELLYNTAVVLQFENITCVSKRLIGVNQISDGFQKQVWESVIVLVDGEHICLTYVWFESTKRVACGGDRWLWVVYLELWSCYLRSGANKHHVRRKFATCFHGAHRQARICHLRTVICCATNGELSTKYFPHTRSTM